MKHHETRRVLPILVMLVVTWVSTAANADQMDEARKLLDGGNARTVVTLMTEELEDNPGHEEAYVLLAKAYEALDDMDKAAEAWSELKTITMNEERRQKARIGLLRTRGSVQAPTTPGEWAEDPWRVPVDDIDLSKLSNDEQPEYDEKRPKYHKESRNFIVFAPTEEGAEVGSKLCEKYLHFLLDRYLDGQAWALRIPIFIFKDHDDYVSVGGYHAASAGVTMTDMMGRPTQIAMYMLDPEGNLDLDSLEGTLPHELTHMVVHEFFGAGDLPLWVDEGMARRMEQTRNDYEEAAKIGRDAVAGEYFRFRDLFELEGYPEGHFRNFRFYEQSATIVLFILERGPEALLTFLQTLKDGGTYDEAISSVFNDIPPEHATEEFEKRWLEWMHERYLKNMAESDKGELHEARTVDTSSLTLQDFDETATAGKVTNWTSIPTNSLNRFKGIGDSRKEWTVDGDRLVCDVSDRKVGTALALRMDEEPPMVVRFTARWRDTNNSQRGLLGIGMLDHRGDDTGIQVMVPLNDTRPTPITCVISDDIAVYRNGECTGRYPALLTEDLDEDIDYPISIVAYSPIEIYNLEAGMIEEFVPLAVQTEKQP